MENVLQELSQLAMLAGLLGGFGFTAIIQLLSMERKGKVATAAILVFALATLMFLLALLMFILTFSAAVELNAMPETLTNLGTYGLLIALIAVFVLEIGIGLLGWIRSKAAGLVTTLLAAMTMCLTSVVMVSVIGHFA